MYLSCHMGSLITPSLPTQVQTSAVKQRIPLRLSQTSRRSDNELRLTSVHITAAISPVIIKLQTADRRIHINERCGAPHLPEENISTLTLTTEQMPNVNVNYLRRGQDSNLCRVETANEISNLA